MSIRRFVDVAVDAAGIPGGRTFTYHLPPALADVVPGEAVLVEYSRQRAVGVVLAETDAPLRATKPVLARIRADGPVLPPLQARLARHIATHYLAPPGLVIRAMLPPGLLERVELLVHARPAETDPDAPAATLFGDVDAADAELFAHIEAAGPRGIAVASLAHDSSRATLLRRIRGLERDGHVGLEWRLRGGESGPRLERRAHLTSEGRIAAEALRREERPSGAPLGPRQRSLLEELALPGAAKDEVAARLAERHGPSAVTGLARRGWLELTTQPVARRPLAARAVSAYGALPAGTALSGAQSAIVEQVVAAIRERRYAAFLIDGATASGKTAVYVAAVLAAQHAGRGALLLVPEITLALPLIDRLRHDLGRDPVLLHSGLSDGERADEWRRMREDPAPVVVGTRLAVLAPIASPGLIIVDEEHDAAYKSDRTPRYQARDVAIELGRLAGAPVVLGSATPDLVSVGRARRGEIELLTLPDRAVGRAAPVEVVDLRAELAGGNRGLLSERLAGALRSLDREAGDRAILVMNRRGSASVVLCRDCGYVQVCPDCQRPLVFHASAMALRCHHCGATAPPARRCPACGSARIRYLGGGTERVEQEVGVLLPAMRVGRLDRDVAERRGAAAGVVDAFASGQLDVLVGTSLVTKGLDIPEVALVGVVSADVALFLPDERAAERTWQLLTQAVGRVGRGERPGRAIVQTYQPEHPAIRAVADGDAHAFVDNELEQRRRFGSPPFGRLIKLTVALEDRVAAEAAGHILAVGLRQRAADEGRVVAVLGPLPAYVARRGGRWRFHVVLRGTDPMALLREDPGTPWSVDVDPEHLL